MMERISYVNLFFFFSGLVAVHLTLFSPEFSTCLSFSLPFTTSGDEEEDVGSTFPPPSAMLSSTLSW